MHVCFIHALLALIDIVTHVIVAEVGVVQSLDSEHPLDLTYCSDMADGKLSVGWIVEGVDTAQRVLSEVPHVHSDELAVDAMVEVVAAAQSGVGAFVFVGLVTVDVLGAFVQLPSNTLLILMIDK